MNNGKMLRAGGLLAVAGVLVLIASASNFEGTFPLMLAAGIFCGFGLRMILEEILRVWKTR